MSNKTILILLDGCRYDAATDNLGYLEHLAEMGLASKFRVMGELPSLSRPMYETLMTGLPVYQHGITNNQIIRNSKQISLFDLCRENKLTTAAAAYHWISELYVRAPFLPVTDRIQLDGSSKIQYGIYYFEDQYPNSHVYADAEYLRQQFHPDFMLVHPMNIDDAGHKYGSNSTEYQQVVAMENILLSAILPIWLEAGYQIMVTADHGMNEHHIHGGNTLLQREVPLYLISDKIKKISRIEKHLSELFIAPMLCHLLGIDKSSGMRDLSEMEEDIFEA